ncbi:MAG: hypothetical protein ACR2Q4_22845, partial [Geminicoccaceae bacterium]
ACDRDAIEKHGEPERDPTPGERDQREDEAVGEGGGNAYTPAAEARGQPTGHRHGDQCTHAEHQKGEAKLTVGCPDLTLDLGQSRRPGSMTDAADKKDKTRSEPRPAKSDRRRLAAQRRGSRTET